MAMTTVQLTSVSQLRQQLIAQMSMEEEKLYSPQIQAKFENSSDLNAKLVFVNSRNNYSAKLANFRNAILEAIASQLQTLEPELDKALKELDDQLKDLENVVGILNTINTVTSIIAKIVTFI
jgi:predicted sulfurtransferase